ncbi:MAG: hypothetical protein OXF02_03585 [Simkaniaceae bacterium]|nr:hypothetical protein [Simkaniaceae bacterium]
MSKEFFTARCGCAQRCRIKRSKGEAIPELEEVVVGQSQSPSPESAVNFSL